MVRDSYTYVQNPDTVHYTNLIESDGVWEYSYDFEGNLTEKDFIGTDERWVYGYDHARQLIHVEHYDGSSTLDLEVDFKYDVFGNRIEKVVDDDRVAPSSPSTKRFAIDGWNTSKSAPIGNENFDVLADLNGSNDLLTRYLRGDRVDEIKGRVDYVDSSWEQAWTLTDRLGSVRDVIDQSEALLDSLNYDGFGNIDDATELDPEFRGRYGWTGREIDVEIELQYNRARYYDATTGRWISQDPLGLDAGDSNLYRYARNSPIQFVDPSGLISNAEPLIPPEDFDDRNFIRVDPKKLDTKHQEEINKRLKDRRITYSGITGTISAYENIDMKNLAGEVEKGRIELEFLVNEGPKGETHPALSFHWLQFVECYFVNAKGEDAKIKGRYYTNVISAKGDTNDYTTNKGDVTVDTLYDRIPYYDQGREKDQLSTTRRTPMEVSLFDAPSMLLNTKHTGEGKQVKHFYSYLVFDDPSISRKEDIYKEPSGRALSPKGHAKVLYEIEWERTLDYDKNANPIASSETYRVISGKTFSKFPAFAQGDDLLWGYKEVKDGIGIGPKYIRNPISLANRGGK